MTGARPRKRSLTLHGHQTSVSLEDEFWAAFRAIAAERGQSLSALAAEIDDARGLDSGLASAIRVFILRRHRNGAGAALAQPPVTADTCRADDRDT